MGQTAEGALWLLLLALLVWYHPPSEKYKAMGKCIPSAVLVFDGWITHSPGMFRFKESRFFWAFLGISYELWRKFAVFCGVLRCFAVFCCGVR